MTDTATVKRADLTGLILCGGKSSRFGSPKSHFELDGVPLVERAANLLSPLVGDVLLSVGDLNRNDWPPLELVPDLTPGIGPIGGIQAGMARGRTDWLLVIAVDLPMITRGDLNRLCGAVSAGDKVVVARDDQGRLQPLCGLYHRSIRNDMEQAIARDEFSMKRLLSSLRNVQYVTLPAANLRNVNRPDDLGSILSSHST